MAWAAVVIKTVSSAGSHITKQLREKDQERYKALEEEHGIKTYVVWELDYKNGIDIEDFIKNTLKIDL